MAGSNPENRDWILQKVLEIQPKSIIDVGAGAGTYSQLLRKHLPDTKFIAVEIYGKNIEQYKLQEMYDEVIYADVRLLNSFVADLVIFGDVLEHMTQVEAINVWDVARHSAKWGIISIPIVHYAQGEVDGNIHEAHIVDDWNNLRVFACFEKIVEAKIGEVTGAYLAKFGGKHGE
jgi:predicted TPR repeat methyltransferase